MIPAGGRREVADTVPQTAPLPSSEGSVVSFIKTVAVFVLAVIFLRGTVVEAFRIPSGSMIPTLQIGDHLLVSKLSYGVRLPFVARSVFEFATPRRGDIVVFTRPDDPETLEDESDINVIKRVVALAGERVEVRGTRVFINGEPLSESYARWVRNGIGGGSFGPVEVPPQHVFLLGDNRDESRDSRFWNNPFLATDQIKGRALIIYWSFDDIRRIGDIVR